MFPDTASSRPTIAQQTRRYRQEAKKGITSSLIRDNSNHKKRKVHGKPIGDTHTTDDERKAESIEVVISERDTSRPLLKTRKLEISHRDDKQICNALAGTIVDEEEAEHSQKLSKKNSLEGNTQECITAQLHTLNRTTAPRSASSTTTTGLEDDVSTKSLVLGIFGHAEAAQILSNEDPSQEIETVLNESPGLDILASNRPMGDTKEAIKNSHTVTVTKHPVDSVPFLNPLDNGMEAQSLLASQHGIPANTQSCIDAWYEFFYQVEQGQAIAKEVKGDEDNEEEEKDGERGETMLLSTCTYPSVAASREELFEDVEE
jgi:hypothetical protein